MRVVDVFAPGASHCPFRSRLMPDPAGVVTSYLYTRLAERAESILYGLLKSRRVTEMNGGEKR